MNLVKLFELLFFVLFLNHSSVAFAANCTETIGVFPGVSYSIDYGNEAYFNIYWSAIELGKEMSVTASLNEVEIYRSVMTDFPYPPLINLHANNTTFPAVLKVNMISPLSKYAYSINLVEKSTIIEERIVGEIDIGEGVKINLCKVESVCDLTFETRGNSNITCTRNKETIKTDGCHFSEARATASKTPGLYECFINVDGWGISISKIEVCAALELTADSLTILSSSKVYPAEIGQNFSVSCDGNVGYSPRSKSVVVQWYKSTSMNQSLCDTQLVGSEYNCNFEVIEQLVCERSHDTKSFTNKFIAEMEIRSITEEDFGIYGCKVVTPAGYRISEFEITKKANPFPLAAVISVVVVVLILVLMMILLCKICKYEIKFALKRRSPRKDGEGKYGVYLKYHYHNNMKESQHTTKLVVCIKKLLDEIKVSYFDPNGLSTAQMDITGGLVADQRRIAINNGVCVMVVLTNQLIEHGLPGLVEILGVQKSLQEEVSKWKRKVVFVCHKGTIRKLNEIQSDVKYETMAKTVLASMDLPKNKIFEIDFKGETLPSSLRKKMYVELPKMTYHFNKS